MQLKDFEQVEGLNGDPFGVSRDGSGEFYLLHTHRSGSADLYRVKDGLVEGSLVHAGGLVWRVIRDEVAAEFNKRLNSKGHRGGSWGEPGGSVRLHWQFGRELEILMLCASESWAGMRMSLTVWLKMDPSRRFACWKKWSENCAGPEWRQQEIVRIVHLETNKERIAEASKNRKLDILYAYIVNGDVKALDDFYPDRAMSSQDRSFVKRIDHYNYAEDTKVTLMRTKLLKEAKDRWAAKRALWAQEAA